MIGFSKVHCFSFRSYIYCFFLTFELLSLPQEPFWKEALSLVGICNGQSRNKPSRKFNMWFTFDFQDNILKNVERLE